MYSKPSYVIGATRDDNVVEAVDARGAAGTTYAGYDGLNRPLWRNTTDSPTGAYVTDSYDATAGGNEGVGRLTGETFSNASVGGSLSGAYSYTYDARGQVTGTSVTLEGGTPATTSASYNDAGQLTAQSYPDGDTLTPSYDPASGWQTAERVQLSGAPSATPLLSDETYSALGELTSATLGAFTGGSGGSGGYTASYDALGRLTNAHYAYTPTGGGTSTLFSVQPVYDALGNVIATTTTLPQGVDTQVFCYDDRSRLVWAGSSGTPGCAGAPTPGDTGALAGTDASYSASYSYSDPAHADAATVIGSSWSAAYDAAGDMTCRAQQRHHVRRLLAHREQPQL